MADDIDTVPVFVVETHQYGDKELAARGFGWPTHEETAKSNQQFVSEMNRLRSKIDVDKHDAETKVAEMTVRRFDGAITSVEVIIDE